MDNSTRRQLAPHGNFALDPRRYAEYAQLRADLISSHQPANAAELLFVDTLARSAWRMHEAHSVHRYAYRAFSLHIAGKAYTTCPSEAEPRYLLTAIN